jgi:hypothetical protein
MNRHDNKPRPGKQPEKQPAKITGKPLRKLFFACFLSASLPGFAATYPATVKAALDQAGSNRQELEAVLKHYTNDSLKYNAACFLIANMPAHDSRSFYWADSLNNKVSFNEFDFPDFKTAVSHFNQLSLGRPLHPVTVIRQDLETITASYLIDNIDKAFEFRGKPWARYLSFEQFCEYLLPYRLMDEPYAEWRTTFQQEYTALTTPLAGVSVRQACATMCDQLRSWFFNTWVVNPDKVEPAFLSPAQILFRRQGACEDMANWGGYTFRSMGIATTIDYTPAWATSTGAHFWNVAFGEHGEAIPFVMGSEDTPNRFYVHREPSKVLRITYSLQPTTLAQQIPTGEIPESHLKASNYIDVTRDYWRVADLGVTLEGKAPSRVAYVSVLNGLSWRLVWWGWVKDNKAVFNDLCCGAVYLPIVYEAGKLVPAAYPCLLRKDKSLQQLKPDETRLRTVSLAQQDKYLIFRPGKKYALYFWQNKWQPIDIKVAQNANPLTFDKVPANALLLLVPEYSENKERPFTIDDTGQREWW